MTGEYIDCPTCRGAGVLEFESHGWARNVDGYAETATVAGVCVRCGGTGSVRKREEKVA